ncbi:hypothetical protein A0128_01630 [Leptospira tipperaryensis]|uniref:Uncharacterized protein n=1 Tax=Leptospira tipperaryensis TaxID=2564040 RepID=A0A1D7UST1_9LEPT|nr:hypothetical protein [Leptospira tipperaryensis]AOP32680.1 hypothetical protein A0128_01630 [Leptospira tipperaryensis]
MSTWSFESDYAVRISKNPYHFQGLIGCFLSLILFFVSIFGFGLFVYAIQLFTEGETFYPGLILFLTFSFLFLLFSSVRTYRKTKDAIQEEKILPKEGILLIKETNRSDLKIDLSAIVCYKIKKRVVSRNGSASSSGSGFRTVWDLFFLKSDGAFYLLHSYSGMESLTKELSQFRSLLPLPVSNDTKENLETNGEASVLPSVEKVKVDSKYLKLSPTEKGTKVEFTKKKTIKDKITILSVMGFFYGVWGIIFLSMKEFEMVFLFFFIPFSILFLGIFTLSLIFIMTKTLELTVDSSGLRIRYRTTLPILSSFLFLERFFPKHVVRHCRANRFPENQSVLTIALKEIKNIPQGKLSFLFNLQTFSLTDYILPGDKELLGIWHLMPWLPDSPGFVDLIAAESAIEERLQLEEDKILFENL